MQLTQFAILQKSAEQPTSQCPLVREVLDKNAISSNGKNERQEIKPGGKKRSEVRTKNLKQQTGRLGKTHGSLPLPVSYGLSSFVSASNSCVLGLLKALRPVKDSLSKSIDIAPTAVDWPELIEALTHNDLSPSTKNLHESRPTKRAWQWCEERKKVVHRRIG